MRRLTPIRPTRHAWPLLAAGVLALAACGDRSAPEPAPRPVLVTTPAAADAFGGATFSGEIRAREESALAFQVGGQLIRRDVDAGAQVRRGQVLAEIDPGDLRLQQQSAQAQVAAAEGEYARARTDRARYAALVDQQLISRSQMDAQDAAYTAAQSQLRAARAQADVAGNQAGYTQLRAPRDGVIASREAEAGQVVAAGQTIFMLAGDGGREVAIALPESQIGAYAIGQPAEIELWNRPGVRVPGTIREIAAAADPQVRTYAARVALTGDAVDGLELGQSARVHLAGTRAAGALQVPLTAIQPGADGGKAVWVVDRDSGTLRSVAVETGAYGARSVTVLSGLAPDALVVAAGGHLLRDGQRVAPVDRENRPVALQTTVPAAGQ
ncbi:efflux RND transporter periplasmic adaptor subunit [Luteimonas sp BLCC-B24]|uniref:efflux RND transporter periplasmic adaptor subunit n=1 Tax=Luteimonas sp. BLCC-B24 TaxID=3025317 RepID=UPI00234E31C0|nr:efflux RND transporter periplasmic adaptor subunit [Luteimonas sp. BLCC-B24]MDC7808315.1 efflux RND transporter periplasmic adaptor subunit [Luteimonas sp. BLCC-B24]